MLLGRAKGMIEVGGLAHAEVDSERADAEFVVWKQWKIQESESVAGRDGVGLVVDHEGPVAYSLQGYGSKQEDGDLGGGEGLLKTISAYRLTLTS